MFRSSRRNNAQIADRIKTSIDKFPYEIDWWPYLVTDLTPHMIPLWLDSEIGLENELWCREWYSNTLRFKKEEDKVKFILRWL